MKRQEYDEDRVFHLTASDGRSCGKNCKSSGSCSSNLATAARRKAATLSLDLSVLNGARCWKARLAPSSHQKIGNLTYRDGNDDTRWATPRFDRAQGQCPTNALLNSIPHASSIQLTYRFRVRSVAYLELALRPRLPPRPRVSSTRRENGCVHTTKETQNFPTPSPVRMVQTIKRRPTSSPPENTIYFAMAAFLKSRGNDTQIYTSRGAGGAATKLSAAETPRGVEVDLASHRERARVKKEYLAQGGGIVDVDCVASRGTSPTAPLPSGGQKFLTPERERERASASHLHSHPALLKRE